MIQAVKQLVTGWNGTGEAAVRKRYGARLDAIKALGGRLTGRGDGELAAEAAALRETCRKGKETPEIDARAMALVGEAVRRTHRLIPYDVQFIAGLALAEGRLVEMATGEGKTLVALLPAFCYGLHGRGAHVATVNPYLAERDFEFARPVIERLGLTIGLLPTKHNPPGKRTAYACDVTYGVGTEYGFDYLRDQLGLRAAFAHGTGTGFHEILLGVAPPKPDVVQRKLAFAVVDEADSVLIDEARSPLIISMDGRKPSACPAIYRHAGWIAEQLVPEVDFETNAAKRHSRLTEAGVEQAHRLLSDEVIPLLQRPWHQYVECALYARRHLARDVHYVVNEDKVVIVDEFTGRLCPERSWRDGIHQAAEATAGVTITEENRNEVAITRPAYFRLYERICGMTGTARESASELRASYGIETAIVPLNRPGQRTLLPDRVFATREAKLEAAARDVTARWSRGRPVLIGSRTIVNSEAMAAKLEEAGIPFKLLNAKQDAEEAGIIAAAGEPWAVTIATNMAGRGAHIPLPPESLRAGGLHVLGLERHESSRIDRQLVGRCARQGEPGSAQFLLSLDDELLQRHAPAAAARLAEAFAASSGELPAAAAEQFLRAQRRSEVADRDLRSQLAKYDDSLDELKQIL